jgi:hypothetical protein
MTSHAQGDSQRLSSIVGNIRFVKNEGRRQQTKLGATLKICRKLRLRSIHNAQIVLSED